MSVRILVGDVRERLAEMPDDSFDCVVTSPPYWGLRDYDCDGQIGLERTLGEHLSVMVGVMREVRRVLKPTGTLWLNYGDCYAASPNGRSAAATKAAGNDDRTFRDKPFSTIGPIQARSNGGEGQHLDRRGGVLKPKDLCMVPNRLAIALQDDGWWVRSEIVWAKPNPMPESVSDRPASAHEKIWLLSKSARYHYCTDAVRQVSIGQNEHDLTGGPYAPPGQSAHTGSRQGKQAATAAAAAAAGGSSGRRMAWFNDRWDAAEASRRDSFARASKDSDGDHGQKAQHRPDREGVSYPRGEGRNLRNYEPAPVQVWPIATRPFPDAHFATFPPELAERCMKAGCPPGGSVLDPFGGAGTVGLVADRYGLDCTLIELNPAYAEIARKRLAKDGGLFASVEVVPLSQTPDHPPSQTEGAG